VLLSVIAPEALVSALETIIFRETSTFGIRRARMARSILQREASTVSTPWGPVRVKRGWREGFEVVTPEYDDCALIAREQKISLREVYRVVQRDSPRSWASVMATPWVLELFLSRRAR
jgi:pyridinium-3,5-bisthiocarboxylic acid mononucleotide nickel chelatase